MGYKKLTMASVWVDPDTNERVKLTHNLKAVYNHKLEQYRSFKGKGLIYHESHQTVADLLSLDYDTVRKVFIPLLKRMGLLELKKVTTRRYITTVYPLSHLRGELLNSKLEKHHNKTVKEYKRTPVTYEQIKTIDKNKKRIQRMNKDLKTEYFVFTAEEVERLRGG